MRRVGSVIAPLRFLTARWPGWMTAGHRVRILVVTLGRRGGVTEYGWLMTGAGEPARIGRRHLLRAGPQPGEMGRTRRAETGSEDLQRVSARSCPSWPYDDSHGLAICTGPRPDVVYYPGGHAWRPLLSLLLPRSAVTILTIHDPKPHDGDDSVGLRLLDRANRRRVAGFVLLSESERVAFQEAQGVDPSQVAVIPHGVFDDYSTGPKGSAEVITMTGVSASEIGGTCCSLGGSDATKASPPC